MKLYYHPVSTTSRPIVLFATESGIDLDYEVVDLFTGAQYQPEYAAINPSRQVLRVHLSRLSRHAGYVAAERIAERSSRIGKDRGFRTVRPSVHCNECGPTRSVQSCRVIRRELRRPGRDRPLLERTSRWRLGGAVRMAERQVRRVVTYHPDGVGRDDGFERSSESQARGGCNAENGQN